MYPFCGTVVVSKWGSTSAGSVLAGYKMWYIYILLCDQETFYIGITMDVDKRLKEHRSKTSFFTKKFSDLKLVYKEKYLTKAEARSRERQLKGWTKAKKKALIKGDIDLLKQLSKST